MSRPPLHTSPGSHDEARRRDAVRDRAVVRVLIIELAINLLVSATKFVVGWSIGAVALVADAVHSLLDGASNVIAFAGMYAAKTPPDAGHPYGHRRFEAMASAGVGLLILGGFVTIARSVVARLGEPQKIPEVDAVAVAAVVATIVVSLAVTAYERRKGKELDSAILIADAGHTFSDAMAAMVVLASLGGSALGLPWADLVAAVIVCGFIGRTGYAVIRDAVDVLADAAQLDPQLVLECVKAVPEVIDAHKIRSRGLPSHVHVDLHIHLRGDLSLSDAHEITHAVSRRIKERFPNVADVVIHTEPAPSDPPLDPR